MKGIAVAGSVIVDKISVITAYPSLGELAPVKGLSKASGGLVPNCGCGIKKIAPEIDVYAIGKVGNDDDGKYVKENLEKYGVDTSGIKFDDNLTTSFTTVISVEAGGRTFFTYNGANAEFGIDDIDFDSNKYKMLHLGYFLLLEKVDGGEGLEILKKAVECGIKTSIDLVSENANRYKLVIPCLKYVDNLIINEVEAGKITGIEPTVKNLEKIAKKLKEYGVRERVIIHAPECGVCYSSSGFTLLPSYDLPKGFIAGSTGAGDAFCSGALTAIYYEKSDLEILETATVCATASLTKQDAISGLNSAQKNKELCKNFNRRTLDI